MVKDLHCLISLLNFTTIIFNTAPKGVFHEREKMNREDCYYEPENDADPDRIDDRISELMQDEYDPTKYSNFSKGVSEARKKDRESVELILQNPEIDYDALGRKLFCMAYDYMENFAIKHAESDLFSGYLD